MWTRRHWSAAAVASAASVAGAVAGATEAEVVVGQIGPFTGIPVQDAAQINAGARAFFRRLNAAGGIGGRRVSLFELDDTFTGDGFVKAFEAAMRRKPLALLSPVGSVVLKRMLDDKLLDGADVIVLNAVPGAEALRNPGHTKLFHIRAGDRQQIEKIVAHVRVLGVSRLAVLHQDIPTGTSGYAVAKAAAGTDGSLSVQALVASDQPDKLSTAAQGVAASSAQATLVLGAPWFMSNAVGQLRKAGVRHAIFALSYASPASITKAAGAGARGVALSQTYPNPSGINLPVQREFQAAMKEAFPETTVYSPFHLEGYIAAKTFAEAAGRAKELTPTGLARALRAMGEVDLGGFRVDFSRSNEGGRFVDIGVINADGRLMY